MRMPLLALGLAITTAVPVSAQVYGIPVVNNGTPLGIDAGIDIASANDAYPGGSSFAVDVHATLGLGFLGITGMISRFNPDFGDNGWSPGVNGTLRLLGGPLIPLRVTLQAGVAHWSIDGADFTHVPISVGIALTIPNPSIAIKPWLAPRLDVLHAGGGFIRDTHDVHFGISGGIDLSLLSGVYIRAAYDRLSTDGNPSTLSLGLGYAP